MDDDLKTPAHDALMSWIDAHIVEILRAVLKLDGVPHVTRPKWEHVIKAERDFVIGFADMSVAASWEDRSWHFFVEAKTRIPSVSELIRQVRFYQSAERPSEDENGPEWLGIAPDDRFAERLRSQGIHFHKSPTL